jgi:TolB-like protein/Tfp pilus assembly protein PilF
MSGSAGSNWWHRLRERGVIRVAASYAVIAWLLLQIADVTFEPLGVPRWAMVSLIVAAILGFPIAVALAWFYEAGDQGIARDTAVAGTPRPVVHGLRRYFDVGIIAVLLLVIAVLLVRQSDLPGTGKPAIAVLPFRNLNPAPDGDVLALGIAETVLHQLANLPKLAVISRTSSFTFANRNQDAREIGRQLGARYLLEGSLQSDRQRMRITTRLVDTQTGADVWSMRFDRRPGDIFEVQDEIALQVTRALQLSLDADERDRLTGQGTQNLDAYLEFLQGRSLQATDRVVDTSEAIGHFERAIEADPNFADAYVHLAAAKVYVAEYEVTDDRPERFERALNEGKALVRRALALDPKNGDAYLHLAQLTAYDNLAASEKAYRRGLELSPNSAAGYAGLATVLYEDPKRREEALELLEHAHKIDPLQPSYYVAKAVFLAYERSDIEGAVKVLDGVLDEHPNYVPALVRLCEFDTMLRGLHAAAIQLCEQAIAADPLLEEVYRVLIRAYLDVEDLAAAQDIADASPGDEFVPRTLLALYQQDWREAGEAAYQALERRTTAPNNINVIFQAIRVHARKSGERARAIAAVEPLADVTWDSTGKPTLSTRDRSVLREAPITLADLLLLDGQTERGHRLLEAVLEAMRHEVKDEGRPEFWYLRWHQVALALEGRRDEALSMLERQVASGYGLGTWWCQIEHEPAFESLRNEPAFQAVLRKVHENAVAQRRELERLRKKGLVPERPAKAPEN